MNNELTESTQLVPISPAPMSLRVFAYIVDLIILSVIVNTIQSFVGTAALETKLLGSFFITALATIGYHTYPIHKFGQSLGKKIFGLRVLPTDGESTISFKKAFMRESVGKTISSLIFMLGFIFAFFDDEKLSWHDRIASTKVVQN